MAEAVPKVEPVIIVHTVEQAKATLAVAAELGVSVTLQSPPDALHYAGSLYLLQLFEAACKAVPKADARFILDCGDAGGLALGALKDGHRHLLVTGAPELVARLADVASQYGAVIYKEEWPSLDLRHEHDPAAACCRWLGQHAKD